MSDLLAMAREAGFTAEAGKQVAGNLYPSIVLLKCGHYVLVSRDRDGMVDVFLPESGWTQWTKSRLICEASDLGVALLGFDRSKALWLIDRRPMPLLSLLQGHLLSAAGQRAIAIYCLVAVMTSMIPYATALTVDSITNGGKDPFSIAAVTYFGISIGSTLVGIAQSFAQRRLNSHVSVGVQTWAFAQMVAQQGAGAERLSPTKAISAFNSVGAMQTYMMGLWSEAISIFILSIVGIGALFFVSPWLVIPSFLSVGISIYLDAYFSNAMQDSQAKAQKLSDENRAYTIDMISQLTTLMRFKVLPAARARLRANVRRQATISIRLTKISAVRNAIQSVVPTLDRLIFISASAYFVSTQEITMGAFVAVGIYKESLATAVLRAVGQYRAYKNMLPHRTAVSDLASAVASSRPARNVESGDIELRGVGFMYESDNHWLLRNVDLSAKGGEVVALSGDSGTGKTTLVRLILGLLDPSEGSISIGGVATSIGIGGVASVLPTDKLLAGSIRDSIRYMRPWISDDDIRWASRLVGLDAFVSSLPMGYDSAASENLPGISSGQRQRILLARALAGRPKILVLDEATSHLDVASETQVLRSIRGLGMTVVLIAHRPEAWRFSDKRYVLEGGRLLFREGSDRRVA